MNFNLVITMVLFCVVVQKVYAERLPSDTKILMDTCYDVMPNCKNDYFAARSKEYVYRFESYFTIYCVCMSV